MKKAVAILEPLMDAEKARTGARSAKGKMVIATVKGDVHDIGKNIVGVVLRCNGYEVTDLGVMVPAHKILDTAVELGADLVGLSGPDHAVARRDDQRRRRDDAARDDDAAADRRRDDERQAHRGEDRAGVHRPDRARARRVARGRRARQADVRRPRRRTSPRSRAKQDSLRAAFVAAQKRPLLVVRRRARAPRASSTSRDARDAGVHRRARTSTLDLAELATWIDWSPFFHTWELSGRYPAILDDPKKGDAARKLFADGAGAARADHRGQLAARARDLRLLPRPHRRRRRRRSIVDRRARGSRCCASRRTRTSACRSRTSSRRARRRRLPRRVHRHRRPRHRRARRRVRARERRLHRDHGQGARRPARRGRRRVAARAARAHEWLRRRRGAVARPRSSPRSTAASARRSAIPACPDHAPKRHAVRRCSTTPRTTASRSPRASR